MKNEGQPSSCSGLCSCIPAGGVVLNPIYYGMDGHTNTMIHEIGHILGLYHVFKGVSERESCDDPCQETVASMETGDLCADTAPTPKSKLCQNPAPVNDTCGFTDFPGAPFNNYMSYTGTLATPYHCMFRSWGGKCLTWSLLSGIDSPLRHVLEEFQEIPR